MKMFDKWDRAWDKDVVILVPYRWNKKYLEGANGASRDIMRRAFVSIIHNSKQYDALLMTVSDWGYCLETPENFVFEK